MGTITKSDRASRWVALACAVGVWLIALPQAKAAEPDACTEAFDQAQDLRAAGKLLAARDRLETCARQSCPEFIVNKCVPWLAETQQAIPTVAIAARAPNGADTLEVTLSVDGNQVATRLTGGDIALDPGEHVLKLEHPGWRPVETKVVLQPGVKNRLVEVAFAAPAPSSAPQPDAIDASASTSDDGPSPLAWVGFGVGAAGLVVGAVAGGLAIKKLSDLTDRCAVGCTQQEIDDGRVIAHVSTVGFAVGGAGLAVGLIALLATMPSGEAESGLVRIHPHVALSPAGITGTF